MPSDEELEQIEEAMIENATGPRRASGDSGSIEQHSLQDQIELEKHVLSKSASRRGLGIRFVKIVPPGSV